MNTQALKAAFNSLSFSARIYTAIVKTARLGHTVAHVHNRKGQPVLAVRYTRAHGFSFTDKSGKEHKTTVLAMLKV